MKYSMQLVASATAMLSAAQAAQFVVYTPMGDDQVVERADAITNPGELRYVASNKRLSPCSDSSSLLT